MDHSVFSPQPSAQTHTPVFSTIYSPSVTHSVPHCWFVLCDFPPLIPRCISCYLTWKLCPSPGNFTCLLSGYILVCCLLCSCLPDSPSLGLFILLFMELLSASMLLWLWTVCPTSLLPNCLTFILLKRMLSIKVSNSFTSAVCVLLSGPISTHYQLLQDSQKLLHYLLLVNCRSQIQNNMPKYLQILHYHEHSYANMLSTTQIDAPLISLTDHWPVHAYQGFTNLPGGYRWAAKIKWLVTDSCGLFA